MSCVIFTNLDLSEQLLYEWKSSYSIALAPKIQKCLHYFGPYERKLLMVPFLILAKLDIEYFIHLLKICNPSLTID